MPVLRRKPSLAVWKFSSCDGCQLSILDAEEYLLEITDRLDIAVFLEATKNMSSGPYDISFVEGSITTPEEANRIVQIRKESGVLVTIGACATAGGIQALRNYANVDDYAKLVYASPQYLSVLEHSEPIKRYVDVDFELYGCPISKDVLLEFISSVLIGKKPRLPGSAVCMECKMNGYPCLCVSHDKPCLGPVTRAGCSALCLSYDRPCFGCFGPKEYANLPSLSDMYQKKGVTKNELIRLYRTFNSSAEAMARESGNLEEDDE